MFRRLHIFFESRPGLGLFLLRIFIGSRLIYGVVDNAFNWDRMMEFSAFLERNSFLAPTFHAVVSVYAQLICGIFILIGYKIRWASLIMVFNFITALVFVHFKIHDSVEGMTPALAMLFGSLCFLFSGGGAWSLEKQSSRQVV